ncbi:TraB/GumN family protein [Chiayiivirga flava]|uniref:TraB/GumN family protein n=1 Tax=Chiayiivirga flava TaxID=659595 RepID=A0A7W8D355_9GAMM|nr:TraB/GumN family protein [Chiayiivirga flava]MBB5206999.1 hypothetical protein [Chiayiivirga flava]
MRHRLLWILLAGVCASAHAEPPVPLLWKATGDAGTVYLLGSFHLLTDDDYPLHASVEAAYDDAEALLFEVDPSAMQSPATAKTMQEMARFDDGRTLRGVISDETESKLAAFLGSEAAMAASDQFEPWYLGMNIAVMAMVNAGLDPSKGLDQHFMQRAKRDAKPASGLETVAEQLGALDQAPLAEQEIMLSEALAPLAELRADIERMHATWRAGDAAGMEEIVNEETAQKTPRMYELINRDRNQRWLPTLQGLLASQDDHLVIVGAMHLIGEDGLVQQLGRRGVTVERVGSAAQ